jgi:pSer/pThr/pTyr-binding forkhead associated (FHA) protein
LDKNTSRMIHLLRVRAEGLSEFNIGRGNEAEVRINDISVSRLHAVIRYKEGRGFFLEDLNSKFGTIALAKDPVNLPPDTPIALQLGRTLLILQAKEVMPQKLSRQLKGRGKSLVMATSPYSIIFFDLIFLL